jgi:hypothetical protein
MSETEKERAAFEKWATESGIGRLWRDTEPGYEDQYADSHTRFAWRAWEGRAQLAVPVAPECKCSLRIKMVGDGCQVCNPAMAAEVEADALADAHNRIADLEAQNAALLQANRDCIDHFNALRGDLVRRLLADHQRVEPHHADQCQLCREAQAAIDGQLAPATPVQEPVGEVVANHYLHGWHMKAYIGWDKIGAGTKLYTHPPQGERRMDVFGYVDSSGMFYSAEHGPAPFPRCTTVYRAARRPNAQPAQGERQPVAWLAYVDCECDSAQDKALYTVSGFMAGKAYNELCSLLGGRFPDAKLENEAPTTHRFFMELFGNSR